MLAWIFRFYFKLQKATTDCSKNVSVADLDKAKIALMILIQKDSFKGIKNHKVMKLKPIVDCSE